MADNNLQRYLGKFSQCRVAVVGDLMLDKYVFGQATRISQEAPVPVVKVSYRDSVPGGAANVARNVVSLGGKAVVFGAVGDDPDGEYLLQLLSQQGVDTSHVCCRKKHWTTVKTRVLAGNQQVVRVDLEETENYSSALHAEILGKLEGELKGGGIQAVIMEDYAKGLFTARFMEQVVALSHTYKVPVALDPHSDHPFNVKGVDIITPNRKEAFALAGISYEPMPKMYWTDTKLTTIGKTLIKKWGLKHLLITLGANGMALFGASEPEIYHYIPTVAQQVFDVSGAGDTVMATLTLGMLAGASVDDACRIANAAAGVVVGKVGTSAIEVDELKEALTKTK